jgi:hypothetical protein
MVSETEIKELVTQSKGSGKSFAEFIAELFKDKFIEVYVGDSYEEVSTEQISMSYPAVLCGKVVAAYKECLVMNCAFINKSNHIQLGNFLFISERAIRCLNEIDGNGTIEDMLLRSKESLDVKAVFVDHHPIMHHTPPLKIR